MSITKLYCEYNTKTPKRLLITEIHSKSYLFSSMATKIYILLNIETTKKLFYKTFFVNNVCKNYNKKIYNSIHITYRQTCKAEKNMDSSLFLGKKFIWDRHVGNVNKR